MPLSIRRAKARAAELRDALEIGETWDASDTERAFNFKKRWDDLVAQAPRGTRKHYEMLGALIAEESPTLKRLVWPT
ncbi:hypothetical protein RDV84_23190 [Lysobacter yananisis]|uniref:Uncharacterized protein n=1 Tax=Lysobacter yananisis TaxID=1003114 RepID=A0ABY9P8Z9_9GAMM|nr:hypothetical protein [Lysobacter yananisis]WMT02833.1 hypothetical protein RDV84_23190 [Lysobacter yananisis]